MIEWLFEKLDLVRGRDYRNLEMREKVAEQYGRNMARRVQELAEQLAKTKQAKHEKKVETT